MVCANKNKINTSVEYTLRQNLIFGTRKIHILIFKLDFVLDGQKLTFYHSVIVECIIQSQWVLVECEKFQISSSENPSSGKSPTVTLATRTNPPYLFWHSKYRLPSTEPLFLPNGSSYWTPTQSPGLKWTSPTYLTSPVIIRKNLITLPLI